MKALTEPRGDQRLDVLAAGAFSERARSSTLEDAARRALDILLSSALLLLLLPLMIAVAVAVKLDSPGPVLFRQARTGRNRRRRRQSHTPSERRRKELFGKPFTLYKFRTMYADARERFPELYRYRYSEEELHTIPIKILVGSKRADRAAGEAGPAAYEDPRVTRVGKWLRRTSLDELPNLLNVLKGDMHLVGPRPDIDANIRYYAGEELRILDVKPGVTGLAQIRGRGLLTFTETNRFDLEYVQNRSLTLDVQILLRTLPVLVKREGAY